MWLGVLLERVGQTARMLDMHHHIQGAGRGASSRWWRPRCGCRCCAPARASRRSCAASRAASAATPPSRSCCSRRASRARCATASGRRSALARRLGATGGEGRHGRGAHRGWRRSTAGSTTGSKDIPLSVHALLTHVVDEASAACQELQQRRRGRVRGRGGRPEGGRAVAVSALGRVGATTIFMPEKRRKQSRAYRKVWATPTATSGTSASRFMAPGTARSTGSSG